MTEKENFLKVIHGEVPGWIPRLAMMGPDPYAKYPVSNGSIGFSFLYEMTTRTEKGFIDMFGVEYESTYETGGMSLPKPGKFILDDIRKWRDVIKVPDISGIDWEAQAKKDLEKLPVNPNEVALSLGTHVGYFQHLMNFMGFTEGLCAMQEEPEEVLELYEYLAKFYETITRKALDYFKPDMLGLTDDTATAQNSFISLDTFRRLVKPYQARLGNMAVERGLPVSMHNCGRCEDFIDDWMEYGVNNWNPAQVMNDLDGIKKKYGNKMVLVGCWNSSGPPGWPDAPEGVVRQAVRDTINRFGPGGGFIFWASSYGPVGDPAVENKRRWITEEYEAHRADPYK